jgi:hypothetical protein
VAKQTKDLAESTEQQKELINTTLLQDRTFLTEAICIALLADNSEERVVFLSEFLSNSSDARFLLRLFEKSPQLSMVTMMLRERRMKLFHRGINFWRSKKF